VGFSVFYNCKSRVISWKTEDCQSSEAVGRISSGYRSNHPTSSDVRPGTRKKVILVTSHRRENPGGPMRNIFSAVKEIVRSNLDTEVVFPVHLNPKVRELAGEILGETERVHLIDPLDYDNIMSRQNKLLIRLLGRPRDFTYDELKSLLQGLGDVEEHKGKTSGSRVAFIHNQTQHIIRLHKPYPGNELKLYQVDQIIETLKDREVIVILFET
jgi:hypothetical protein